jgi:uncharacterized DUF497 family protein
LTAIIGAELKDKRLVNLRKHGIDFIDVLAVFDGDTVTVENALQPQRAAFHHVRFAPKAQPLR